MRAPMAPQVTRSAVYCGVIVSAFGESERQSSGGGDQKTLTQEFASCRKAKHGDLVEKRACDTQAFINVESNWVFESE